MDVNYLKKLVKLLDESGLTDMEIEEEGSKIRLSKKTKTITQVQPGMQMVQPQIMPQSVPLAAAAAPASPEKLVAASGKDLHEIKSPIVGTFYRAPAPDADEYCKVGDTVSVGSVLCIVEAMKLMNEIESDVNGKVVKILVENGKPVEYNQPLFLIEKS